MDNAEPKQNNLRLHAAAAFAFRQLRHRYLGIFYLVVLLLSLLQLLFYHASDRIQPVTQLKEKRLHLNANLNGVANVGFSSPPPEVVFLVILCDGNAQNDTAAGSASRQIRQLEVMLKSAVALTTVRLRVLIVADSRRLFDSVVSYVEETWPAKYEQLITFQYHQVYYPPDRLDMRNMFRTCATARLFVPDILPGEDAAIYLDTDVVFMTSPVELWDNFNRFNDTQLAAMAPCDNVYGGKYGGMIPHYGQTGLNAGVMLMNLTRIRVVGASGGPLPGGWVRAVLRGYDAYKQDVHKADQDILNIFFSQHPDMMHVLGCEWNYRLFQCTRTRNKCPVTDTRGVALLHGNARVFVSDKESRMKAVYDSWQQYDLNAGLHQLYRNMTWRLSQVVQLRQHVSCARLPNMDAILTRRLQLHLERLAEATGTKYISRGPLSQ